VRNFGLNAPIGHGIEAAQVNQIHCSFTQSRRHPMTHLTIKDLERETELAADAMQATAGGFNFGMLGGQAGNQLVGGGGILSPVTAVNVPVNVPVLINLDIDPVVGLDLDTNNIIASAGTGVVG